MSRPTTPACGSPGPRVSQQHPPPSKQKHTEHFVSSGSIDTAGRRNGSPPPSRGMHSSHAQLLCKAGWSLAGLWGSPPQNALSLHQSGEVSCTFQPCWSI